MGNARLDPEKLKWTPSRDLATDTEILHAINDNLGAIIELQKMQLDFSLRCLPRESGEELTLERYLKLLNQEQTA